MVAGNPALKMANFTKICLNPQHLQKMIAHVSAEAPLEACGILAGIGDRSTAVIPVTNILASPVRYRIDPTEQLEAMVDIEENGWQILGLFHSHTKGQAYPSRTDISEAFYPNSVYLILAPEENEWICRAFTIDENGVSEVKIEVASQ